MSLSSSLPRAAPGPQGRWPTRSTFQELEHVAAGEHLLQLYETEPYLAGCVSRFLRHALRAGGGALLIATAEHREAVETALDLEEISVGAASRRRQYVALDADTTLATMAAAGELDPRAFRSRIGRRIAELSRSWPHVRVFDESDALLWLEGRHGEAATLERAWSGLRGRHRFARLSALPVRGFSDDFARAAVGRLCAGPVRVLPPQRSIQADVLRGLRSSRTAPPVSTHRRTSRRGAGSGRTAAAR